MEEEKRLYRTIFLCLLGVIASAPSAWASEEHETKHHVALFLGATDGKARHDAAFTVGLDYERHISRWFRAVVLFDYAARPSENGCWVPDWRLIRRGLVLTAGTCQRL